MSVYPKQKTGELLGLFYLSSAFLLLLSLLSYNRLDGSMNVSTPSPQYSNFVGEVGAWLADFLLQFLGLPAFFLPIPFLLLGYRKVRGRSVEYPVLNTLSILASLLMLCAVCFLLAPSFSLHLDYGPGGVIGILIGRLLLRHLNTVGALVVVVTALLMALVLTTRFSFDSVLSWAGDRQWKPLSGLDQRYRQWRKRRRDRRDLKRQESANRSVLSSPPPAQAGAAARKAVADSGGGHGTAHHAPWEPLLGPMPTRTPQLEAIPPAQANPQGAARPYQFPPLDFLRFPSEEITVNEQELMARAGELTDKCAEFDVNGRVLQIHPGPVVTTFEFKPDPGVKYSRLTSLVEDLCLAMKAESIRIQRIPGKNTVGIEVPNTDRQVIYLREILSSATFQNSGSLLTVGLGKLINGNTYVSDLARMPHLLIAGATGAGKSVALNCIICSILYRALPDQVKFILIDPKRLELGLYADLAHLLTPIVTDPAKAANALNWAIREMEGRYKLLARQGVRNIDQYNRVVRNLRQPLQEGEETLHPLPYIVVVVDELADLMMTAGKEVEASLTRLAQMARAIGIHLILATQRPSVDVLTGLIKANFPSRISFRVSSKVDSRTIIDANGAEQLLGQGDMLLLSPRTSRPLRIHGGFVTEKEIHRITEFLRAQAEPFYQEEILAGKEEKESGAVEIEELDDPLYQEAARFVVETGKASTSLLQRRFRVGYGRAARLLDMMEHEGLISPPDGSKAREVLVASNYFDEVEGESL
ncbi:MAG: DNA translocase FtsK [Acidobacteriota bacterium]